ncbi:MAG TPA: hypothetical protein VF384_02945 [Planctomycetota bacterium]
MTTRILRSLAFAALPVTTTSLPAQCANEWASFGTLPGVDNTVQAVTSWDPDGPGPATPRAVVAGLFSTAGGVAASRVAAWDPATATWSALGAGVGNQQMLVNALLALPNGDLIAGGMCSSSGTAVHSLLRWDGVVWTPFGGLTPTLQGVAALARLPNGDLAVGGHFSSAGTTALSYVGVWNGTTWSSLAGGMDGPVLELVVMPNGDLIALGEFTVAGGVPANGVARWNGTAWSAVGSGISGSVSGYGPRAETAVLLSNGDLVVGGTFTYAGGVLASNLARWDGSSWSAFGGGVGGGSYTGVRGLAVLPSGHVVAGGYFMNAGGVPIPNIARWDGSAWSSLGTGIPTATTSTVTSLAVLPNGDLVAGGEFTVAGGVGASRVARWDGTAWSSLGDGEAPSDYIRSLVTMPDGSVVAGGAFRAAGSVEANGIARWDGVRWSALGSGFPQYRRVNAIFSEPNGDLIAGGNFGVSRWDGIAWTQLPAVFGGSVPHAEIVKAVAVLPNGEVVVGGDFALMGSASIYALARWDGAAWSEIGGGVGWYVHALAVLANGDLIAGGDLAWAGSTNANGIARWNGTSWSTLGSGLQTGGSSGVVHAIAPLPNGALIAGGEFTTAGGLPANNIARWNGAAWSPLGAGLNGVVQTVHVLPNGDVVAAGMFWQPGPVMVGGIARWNGSSWSAIGTGVQSSYRGVRAITALPDGDLLVGGGITFAGGQASPNLARLTTTCAATVQSTGPGCAGDTVTATLPWTGSTWRADASGLPSAAVVAVVNGFATTSLPFAGVFATALPGCTLHVRPDVVDLIAGVSGTATFQFAMPNSPSLAGIVFHHQMVPLALDSTLAVTATNALRLLVGSF